MKTPRYLALALATTLTLGATVAYARPKPDANGSPSPAPSGSTSPAPLPTATPEPPSIAVPRLEAKLKADPNNKEALQSLAQYYLEGNDGARALGLTQKLLSLGVKNAQVYYLDGVANETIGQIPQATADFEQASNLEPTNAQVLLTLTELYLREKRPQDAERVAKRATTFNQTDPRSFENYGLVLGEEGKYDDARTQFESAAKLSPKDPLPVVLEARSYISQKAFALATQDFDRALTIDPKYPDALLGKARLQAANHDVTGAIATYEQLLPIVPTDDAKAAIIVEEYQLYRDEKMRDQAVAVLKRGVAAYPNSPAVHIAYGDYDVAIARDQNAAEAEWKTALGPSRNSTDALTRLGELALQQRKSGDAIGYFKRLTEVVPNDPGAWTTLGQVEAQGSKFADARDAFRHSFELSRTPGSLAGVGTSDYELHNFKECSQVFDAISRNAADFMKQNPQLLFVYGQCATRNGQKDKARVALTQLRGLLKTGSPPANNIDKMLHDLGSAPKTSAKSSPKPTPKASSKPAH